MANILVVDDERNMRRSLCIALGVQGYETAEAASGEEAIDLLKKEIYDIVLTDLVMKNADGIEVLRKTKELSPTTEVLLMSAHGTIAKAVEAMQEGAYDFIVKPFSMDHLGMVLNKILNQVELKQTVKHLKAVLADHYPFEDIVAVSSGMQDVMHQVNVISNWSIPVLIHGESGVGKELVALAIHNLSERSGRSFIPVNCGALSETLLDSELFGHCKGAFTGAIVNKRGLIEESDRGTLLLDEIGEAPAALQVRLLRFLDNGHFRRIGEVVERKSDVRVIAATNRDLAQDIKNGKFREDLYYRLSVAVIRIPPLRERRDDIAALSQRFLEIFCKKLGRSVARFHPRVYELFQNYEWPGNVRELENTIEHALIVSKSDEICMDDLPPKFRQMGTDSVHIRIDGDPPLEEVEKKYIFSVLNKTKGNKKRAAGILRISRTTLISRLNSYKDSEKK
ncbi:MAG: sigma-54 dependent transcriptional regulator [bacterium]